ncbi:haptoglobin [Acipenser ruthenus]|uniref:haptoglobin n=1 Tax=Acipenser ruthenus TaxID=7906 RepID=UPI0027419FFA|nr:haptoglobin [Acipenser ruthenus]
MDAPHGCPCIVLPCVGGRLDRSGVTGAWWGGGGGGGLLAPNVPWHALVSLKEDLVRGGGDLISERWVLTTRRNLMDSFSNATKKELPRVYVGITELHHANHSAEVPVEQVIMHPRFQNSSEWENNLALIKHGEKCPWDEINVPLMNENVGTKYSENTCWGDAGAAFAVQDLQDGAWYLAGILSFDKSCSVETYSVSMKLSSYLPWIYPVLGNY